MHRILVAIDGSPRAKTVLDTAALLANKLGGKVHLFRSVGIPAGMPSDAWKLTETSLLEMLREEAVKYLAQQAATLPPEIVAGREVEIGVAWDAICASAQRIGADLIVIGSHGYGGMDRLLGTTAAKVVNHADRSVLVVRGDSVAH
jgi:nucleotide-binding universal stress UspA family protein